MATTFKFGDLELDVKGYELRRLGRRVKIERIPMDLLILLLERHGDLVSRDEIVDRLWGKDSFLDAESGVNTAVRKVRQALKDSTAHPVFIQTVSGKGYRFCGPVEPGLSQEVVVPTGLEPEPSISPRILAGPAPLASCDNGRGGAAVEVARVLPAHQERRAAIWSRKRTIATTVAAGSLLLLLAIYLSGSFLPKSRPSARVTLALLPFENLTGDADQEYFADGLSEETIAVLGELNPKRLMVIARSSTMTYKRRTKTAGQIGQELGADYLLEGSVRRDRERVRVTVKLIRVRDQSRIWSQSFDRFGSGVIQIQDDLGNAIARQIQVELLSGDTDQRQTRTLDAYDPYLLGRHFWNQLTPPAIRKSIEYFQTAVAKDPSYALAFAGLADAYTILPITSDARPRDMWPLARNAASEAIRLNGSLAEAQAAGGSVDFWLEWDWGRAGERFRRAIQLSPNNAKVHASYAQMLSNSGQHSEAIAEITKAHQLDPFSPITDTLAGQFLLYSGRYTEAIEATDKAFSIDPGFWVAHFVMGAVYERTGKPEAAIQSFEKAYNNSGGNLQALAAKGYVMARTGRRAEAEQIVHVLIETGKGRFVSPSGIALVYAGLGNRESALQWLEKGFEARDVHMVFLTIDPMWDDLRSDPRFQLLLKRCRFILPQTALLKTTTR